MPIIYSYQKYIDRLISRTLRLPEESTTHSLIGTELATVDGITYVSLPEGAVLPSEQPDEIAASIQQITLTDEQRDAIKAASPHVKLINARVIERVRSRYNAEDESKYARIGVGVALGMYTFQPGEQAELIAFGTFVQDARAWGRAEKAKLGL